MFDYKKVRLLFYKTNLDQVILLWMLIHVVRLSAVATSVTSVHFEKFLKVHEKAFHIDSSLEQANI